MEPQGEQADFELRHWDGSDEDDKTEDKWGQLLDLYASIEDEPFWQHLRGPGIRLVKGDGPATAEDARVMIVGEGPGAIDNGAGVPFAGGNGELLNQCLEVAGLRRNQCFVTHLMKYRTRDGRPPGYGYALHAQDAIRKEWAIIKPIITICIGAQAHGIISPVRGMMALHQFPMGELWTFGGRDGTYVTSMLPPHLGARHARYRSQIEGSWETLGASIDDLGLRAEL